MIYWLLIIQLKRNFIFFQDRVCGGSWYPKLPKSRHKVFCRQLFNALCHMIIRTIGKYFIYDGL
ncbi:hypothetical protein CSC29_2819 [Pseudomonas aeruginosa]|nr:hypothetical protein CSC29_2819 [Pseudomonas aeruginosa]